MHHGKGFTDLRKADRKLLSFLVVFWEFFGGSAGKKFYTGHQLNKYFALGFSEILWIEGSGHGSVGILEMTIHSYLNYCILFFDNGKEDRKIKSLIQPHW